MSRSDRAAKGFVAALVQYASQIAVQVLLAPLVLKMAGRETLGAYAAIMQAVGLLGLVNFSSSWVLDRYLAQATGLEDSGERFRNVFITARTVLLATNIIFAILLVIGSQFIGRIFHLTPMIAAEARYALYVIAVWAILSTVFAAYGNASLATQDIAAFNIIGTGLNVARSVVSLLYVLAGGGLFGLMLAGTSVDVAGGFLYRRRFLKMNPGFRAGWGIPDKALLREILRFGGYSTFMNIGNRLFVSSTNLVAGITTGAIGASAFYSSQMPATTAYNMLYRLTESATPAVHELYGKREMQKLSATFVRLLRLMLMMTFPLAVGVILFDKDVVTCWVGAPLYAGALMSNALGLYISLSAIQGIVIVFCFAIGWVRLLAASSFLVGITNFGLGLLLGHLLGLGGIMLSLVLVMIPQVLVLLSRLDRTLEVNTLAVVGKLFLRSIIPLGLASLSALFVHSKVVIAKHHFSGLLLECLTFVILYSPVTYLLVMNHQDQADFQRYLSKAVFGARRLIGWPFRSS
ncbi:MAG: hypothetical protein ACP5M4_06310 [Acidobacteriaceae bacterium]